MNIQPVFTRYDINRKIPFDRSSPIVVDHVEDFDTRFIEVFVYESIYNKQVDLKGTTITARIVAALSTEKILLNDNVACTLNGSGNIIIPIDGKVIETLASTLLIEVRMTQDDQALVLPFPLYVQMRGSILDDAGIAPESRGTIPELLEAAIAALEEAKNYENLENKPQINGHTLIGNQTSDDLDVQKKLTAGQNITIENDGTISAEGGGSQIVSGVVNANGTITFTDSDGNTFTTSGSSVIGADGFSPVATVTQTASGATVSITDKNGTTTANISNGAPGQDYVLTEQDKSDIANIVLGELPTTEGVLYGNTSD